MDFSGMMSELQGVRYFSAVIFSKEDWTVIPFLSFLTQGSNYFLKHVLNDTFQGLSILKLGSFCSPKIGHLHKIFR